MNSIASYRIDKIKEIAGNADRTVSSPYSPQKENQEKSGLKRMKELIHGLQKEPQEKSSKTIEDLRKIVTEIPYFKQLKLNDELLNVHDISELCRYASY